LDPSPTLAPRTLFRSDSAEGPRGEKLMHDAIREVECLKEMFTGAGRDRDQNHLAEAECCSPGANGDAGAFNGSLEFCRADSDAGQRVSAAATRGVGGGGVPRAPSPRRDRCALLAGRQRQPAAAEGAAGGEVGTRRGGDAAGSRRGAGVPQFPPSALPRGGSPSSPSNRR
uniref:Uncharacterized protein n=1 Tax=Apteryx owenii TaxID=8824 RepID=A0A8B9QKC2_APTOW